MMSCRGWKWVGEEEEKLGLQVSSHPPLGILKGQQLLCKAGQGGSVSVPTWKWTGGTVAIPKALLKPIDTSTRDSLD